MYLTGQFRGTADFEPGPGVTSLTSDTDSDDIFVARYTADGSLVWARRIGGISSSESGEDLAVDSSGNVYVAGYFSNTVDFDPGPGTTTLTSQGPNNAFLLKLTSGGNFAWARRLGGSQQALGNDVAANDSAVYVTGVFQGTADFDGVSRSSAGDRDIFVGKWDSNGNRQWVNTYSGTGRDVGYGVALDASGNLYAVGQATGPVSFGGDMVNGGFGYALKLDSGGNHLWARATGGLATEIAVSPAGVLHAAGVFDTTVDFDPGPDVLELPRAGSADLFVSQFDSDGSFRWAGAAGGGQHDRAYGVALDAKGNVLITGHFEGSPDFDPGPGSGLVDGHGGFDDAFLVQWTAASGFQWARALGSSGTDRGYDVAVGPTGSVYFTGYFSDTATSDSGGSSVITLAPIGNGDVFLARLDVPPPNSSPTIDPISDWTVSEGSRLSFTVSATDPDAGQTLTFSLGSNAPAGAAIDASSGQFTWTPTEAQGPGTYPITVIVADSGHGNLRHSRTFSVTVAEANQAPVLGAIENRSVDEGAELQFTVMAADPDAPSQLLSFRLAAGAPAGVTIDAATGEFTWRPTESQGPGTYVVTVEVDDSQSPALSDSRTFTIFVQEVNFAPVLATIGSQAVTEGVLLTFTASAVDSDSPANSLRFNLGSAAPTGATIDATTGEFRWTPSEAQGGSTYAVTVLVADDGVPSALDSETIFIQVNDPPTISGIADQSTNEGTATGSIAFTIRDLETAAADLAVTGSSSNTTLVPNANIVFGGSGADRTVTITPRANQVGSATITVTVSDGKAMASTVFKLTVRDTTPPSRPAITNVNSDTGSSSTDAVTSDQTLVLSGTAEAGSTLTITCVGTRMVGTATADGSGNWTVDFSATTLASGRPL